MRRKKVLEVLTGRDPWGYADARLECGHTVVVQRHHSDPSRGPVWPKTSSCHRCEALRKTAGEQRARG